MFQAWYLASINVFRRERGHGERESPRPVVSRPICGLCRVFSFPFSLNPRTFFCVPPENVDPLTVDR